MSQVGALWKQMHGNIWLVRIRSCFTQLFADSLSSCIPLCTTYSLIYLKVFSLLPLSFLICKQNILLPFSQGSHIKCLASISWQSKPQLEERGFLWHFIFPFSHRFPMSGAESSRIPPCFCSDWQHMLATWLQSLSLWSLSPPGLSHSCQTGPRDAAGAPLAATVLYLWQSPYFLDSYPPKCPFHLWVLSRFDISFTMCCVPNPIKQLKILQWTADFTDNCSFVNLKSYTEPIFCLSRKRLAKKKDYQWLDEQTLTKSN